jgi:hypothetical protein
MTGGRYAKRGRESLRDIMLRNQSTLDMYADLSGKPRVEVRDIPAAPKSRAPAAPSGVPLERDVLREIIDGLRSHPAIGLVERINSGSAVETNSDGSKRHIQFHHVYRVGSDRLAAVDISCTLKPSGRRFVIEVKRPGWKTPRGEREEAQAAYIARVIECGGHGMFATSWAQVETVLNRL